MSKKVKKSKRQQESKIYHKHTYGESGFSGVIGKVAKIIGIVVLIIVIMGGLYVAYDYNKDISVNVLADEIN